MIPFLIETVFFLYKTSESMLDTTIRPYIIKVVCEYEFKDNITMCVTLDSFPDIENDVQEKASQFIIIYKVLLYTPAIILGMFCGAWSDKRGRKLPMVLPSFGSAIAVLLYILSTVFRGYALALVLFGAFVQGILGKSSVITMAVYAYASETTATEERSKKLGRLLAMNFFGSAFGALLTGVLQDISGVLTSFCVVAGIHLVVIGMVLAFVEETIFPSGDTICENTDYTEGLGYTETCQCGVVSQFKESVHVLTTKRTNGYKKCILVLIFMSALHLICKAGEVDVILLYVSRAPLSWSESTYGYLVSLDYGAMGLALLVLVPFCTHILKMHDGVILVIGITVKIVRCIWTGFIQDTWMMFALVATTSIGGVINSSVRSLLSKTVDKTEMGKIFSLLASVDTVCKLLGNVILVTIYRGTAFIFPGFAFCFIGLIYIVTLVPLSLCWNSFRLISKNNDNRRGSESCENLHVPKPELRIFVIPDELSRDKKKHHIRLC